MIIPIVIPTGYTYSCTVTGSSFKIVQCEHCRFIYVYKMERTAAGTSSESLINGNPYAGQQAEAAAMNELSQKLHNDCDAIPCLECGKYQQHMIDALKRDFMSTTWYAACIGIGAGITFGFFTLASMLYDTRSASVSWTLAAIAVACAVGGAFLLKLRQHQLARFEPNNDDLATRMQLASRYAKTLEDFQAYLKYHGIDWQLPADLTATNDKTSESIQPNRRRRRI